jgi:MFS family permease
MLLAGRVISSIAAGAHASQHINSHTHTILFTVLMTLASNLWMLLAGRVISGIAVGAESSLVPVLLSEIAPPAIRGQVTVLHQVSSLFFLLLSVFCVFVFVCEL